jgi:hypothetical protein
MTAFCGQARRQRAVQPAALAARASRACHVAGGPHLLGHHQLQAARGDDKLHHGARAAHAHEERQEGARARGVACHVVHVPHRRLALGPQPAPGLLCGRLIRLELRGVDHLAARGDAHARKAVRHNAQPEVLLAQVDGAKVAAGKGVVHAEGDLLADDLRTKPLARLPRVRLVRAGRVVAPPKARRHDGGQRDQPLGRRRALRAPCRQARAVVREQRSSQAARARAAAAAPAAAGCAGRWRAGRWRAGGTASTAHSAQPQRTGAGALPAISSWSPESTALTTPAYQPAAGTGAAIAAAAPPRRG